MNVKKITIVLFALMSVNTVFAQQFNSPGDYNNYIVKENTLFSEKMMQYTLIATHSESGAECGNALRAATRQLLSGLGKIERLEAYKGDSRFRNEALSIFKQHKDNMEAEFDLLITLKEGSKNSYEAMEKYYKASDRAQKKLAQTYERFNVAQREFAKKYNMTINKNEDTEFEDIVKVINEVQDYTQKIYLASFRVEKAEAAFIGLMNEKKVNTTLLERRRTDLVEAVKLATTQIDTVPKKYPDDKYRDAVKKKIDFYKVKADKDFSELVRIQIAGAKKTNADVEIFNKIINDLNVFNQTNTKELNETKDEVSRKHIPKPKGATRRM